MAINQDYYVLITSGVGGQPAAGRRELIARIFTTNILAPMGGVLEFGGGASVALKNVGAYFGTDSNEYAMASDYFSFVSKDIRQADKISFARYSTSALKAMMISTVTISPVATFKTVTDGALVLNFGGQSYELAGIDLSAAVALADVVTAINDKMPKNGETPVATVSFENGKFILEVAEAEAMEISASTSPSAGTDLSASQYLGWDLASSPILSQGSNDTTLTAEMDRISNTSNNFGSFCFVEALATDQIAEVAKWNGTQNVKYLYSIPAMPSTAAAISAATVGQKGACPTLTLGEQYDEIIPMAIGACIDFTRPNASVNFMYHEFPGFKPTVSTDSDKEKYDALNVNYYGVTQQAGQLINFYQMGYLQGEIQQIGVYWNEMWFKDAIKTDVLNMFLLSKSIPVNKSGKATAIGVIQGVINEALNNGVILVEKELTNAQKAYITQLSGDDTAWRSVQSAGYWLNVEIKQRQVNGKTQYYCDYVLIYAKGDSIVKLEGSDVLI